MMTSAGLVRASVLLTAQTCIAANLTGVEDLRLGGPCSSCGRSDGEEMRTYSRQVSNLDLYICSKVPLEIANNGSSTVPFRVSGTLTVIALGRAVSRNQLTLR